MTGISKLGFRSLRGPVFLLAGSVLSGCFVGVFNNSALLEAQNSPVVTASGSPTPDVSGSSSCSVPGDTGNGSLDTCFNPTGSLPGYLQASEFSDNALMVASRQSSFQRPSLTTDSQGNIYTLHVMDPNDVFGGYSTVKTASSLCQIKPDLSARTCLTIGDASGGALPGGLHVSADGDLYVAYGQISQSGPSGQALSSSNYQVNLRICRYITTPAFGIDTSFGSMGCFQDMNIIGEKRTTPSLYDFGMHHPNISGDGIFLDSRGTRSGGDFFLAAGMNGNSRPYLLAITETGALATAQYSNWSSGYHNFTLRNQSYVEVPGVSTTMDFAAGSNFIGRIVGLGFQSTGKLVVGMLFDNPRGGLGTNAEFIAVRFDLNGTLDSSFGTVSTNNDGYLWIAKQTTDSRDTGFDFYVDLARTASTRSASNSARMIVDSEDRILIAGTAFNNINSNSGNFRVIAYDSNGTSQTASTGASSISAQCSPYGKSNLSIIETPGAVAGEDRIFVACLEEYSTPGDSIWNLDSGTLAPITTWGTAGKLVLQNYTDTGSTHLALIPDLPSLGIGRRIVFLGSRWILSAGSDIPMISRYSYWRTLPCTGDT